MKACELCFVLIFAVVSLIGEPSFAGEARAPSAVEWEKTIESAKKESKIVAGIPASAELRKSLEEIFSKRFPGIELELTTGRGPTNASKIAAEHAAGVRYYDIDAPEPAECRHIGTHRAALHLARS